MFSVIGAAMLSSPGRGQPGAGISSPADPGLHVSYGATIFLFLPCLFLLSLWTPVTAFRACLVGLLLGELLFVPLTWLEWKSSGPDSGPLTAVFPLAGLITAGLYWWPVAQQRGRSIPSPG